MHHPTPVNPRGIVRLGDVRLTKWHRIYTLLFNLSRSYQVHVTADCHIVAHLAPTTSNSI